MTMTTGVLAVVLTTLGACGTDEEPAAGPGEPAASATATPPGEDPAESSGPPATGDAPQTAADLEGEWGAPASEWTVRFNPDGTFTEDFEGVKDFRVGTYTLEDGVVTLEGDDGNADEGTVEGETLVFRLGTLERL